MPGANPFLLNGLAKAAGLARGVLKETTRAIAPGADRC
jgi:hypothetical protein